MKVEKLVAVLGLILGLSVSQSAGAQSRSVTARAAEDAVADPDRTPFSGQIGLGTMVGSGTFISDQYLDDPLVIQSLSLSGTYRVDAMPILTFLSVRQGFSFEYTQPGARNGRKWDYSDTSIGLSVPSLWTDDETGLNLTVGLGATLPISFASRRQDKYTSLSFGPTLGLPLGDFYLTLGGGVGKSFHKYTNRVDKQADLRFGDEFGAYCRQGEVYCDGGPFLVSWTLGVNGGVSYTIMEKLSAGLNLGWGTAWTYDHEADELSSDVVLESNRNRLPDSLNVGANVSYMFDPLLSFSLGANTSQPFRTADQKGIRNPLWSRYARNNSTTLSLNLSAGF